MTLPLVSVVVTGYCRPEALMRAVQSVRMQTYARKEIVIVYSGPKGDESTISLNKEFSDVRFILLDDHGACAARNRGVEAARGEIVAIIDDDTFFASSRQLENVVSAFESHSRASCVVFKVLEPSGRTLLRDWCHPRSYWEFADRSFETLFIAEGASAFRRDHFLRLGGYYEPFWIGDEGWDLALRMIDSELHIFYDPRIQICHAVDPVGRPAGRIYYLKGRNCIWTAVKDYTGHRRWRFLAYHLLLMTFFSLQHGNFAAFVGGVINGIMTRSSVPRTPVSKRGWNQFRRLTSLKPSLSIRWKKLRCLKTHIVPL